MELHDQRVAIRQLAEDLQWFEDHCRKQPDLAAHAGELRLAAALTRNVIGPALEKAPASPLVIAVVGGAGAGKSTLVNLLVGSVAAEANPQAGYTRHPTAYVPVSLQNPWPGSYLGFLGPLRRMTGEHPANLDEDVYQVRNRPSTSHDPLAGYIVWDCPDMTTWAATGYVSRLVEVAALADIIVYAASDERYNDEVPTQFLHLLARAGKAIIVCITKMREADASGFVEHFRSDVLTRITGGTTSEIPPIPVLAVPNLTPEERSHPATAAAKYRVPLINQLLVLCPNAEAARQRTVKNAIRFLESANHGLLDVARKDLAVIEAWKSQVQAGRAIFEERYTKEYLAGEPFRRFDRTKEHILSMLELPAGARYVSAVLTILRMPWTFVRDQAAKLVSRPPVPSLPEADVLMMAERGWVEGLQAETLRQSPNHPLWKQLSQDFEKGLRTEADERFRQSSRQFELLESDELEKAARSLPANLESHPFMLMLIRISKVVLEVAAVAVVLVETWVPSWYHLLLIPLAVSLVHQAFEIIVGLLVNAVRHQARNKRERLLADQLSRPFAAWLEEVPFQSGSPAERLRQVLARIPTLIREIASDPASTPKSES